MHLGKVWKWKFLNFRSRRRQWYRVCTKAMFTSKGSYGYGEPENAIAFSVQYTHWAFRSGKERCSMHLVKLWKWEFFNFRSRRRQWYRGCTKATFASNGSYGYGETENVITFSVQQTQWAFRSGKERRLKHLVNLWKWTFLNFRSCRRQWYRGCTKAMFTSKGSWGYGEPKN